MARAHRYTAISLDLGDVLSTKRKRCISPLTLRASLSSSAWFEYKQLEGRFSQAHYSERVGTAFMLDPSGVQTALDEARDLSKTDDGFVVLIEEVRSQVNGHLTIFALADIPSPDDQLPPTKPPDLFICGQIFTCGAVVEHKPDLCFCRNILQTTGVDPSRTILIYSRVANVLSTRSFGLHGVVSKTPDTVKRTPHELVGDQIARGHSFLRRNAGMLYSEVTKKIHPDDPPELWENFSQLLILETTNDRSLAKLVEFPREWNFFQGKDFPCDIDTTSVGLVVLRRNEEIAQSVINEMLQYVNSDGIILTYFDHKRPRFDPVVCVNALTLFYAFDRGPALRRTLSWVIDILRTRAYLNGTRYYTTPECFFFFLRRLLLSSPDPYLHSCITPLLKDRVQERIGAPGDAMALAMRLLVCQFVDVRDQVDVGRLLGMQCADGGWEIGWIYLLPTMGIRVGNRGLTTALAMKAIKGASSIAYGQCETAGTNADVGSVP